MILEWETEESGVFSADGPRGEIYLAESCGDHWHFERWSPSGVMTGERQHATFEEGCFEMCAKLGYDGWTVDGVTPALH